MSSNLLTFLLANSPLRTNKLTSEQEHSTTLTSNLPQALVLTSQIVSTVRFDELSCSEAEKDGLSVYVRGSCFVSNFRPFSTEAFNF